ncbi:MAG: hypothetical protein WBW48_11560 [Anaerolineae bacterium]
MSKPKRHAAFLAYLLPVVGWLYVFLFHRKDELAVHHAKQSMVLTMTAVGAPAAWALVAWIVSWIPWAGSVISAALFALVILTYIFLAVIWVIGMVYALQAKMKPVPVLGGWAERIPIW